MALRWAIDCGSWCPSARQFDFLLRLLPLCEWNSVLRYVKVEDRKRALLSRLLQRMAVHSALGIAYQDITISRTREGKPYLAALSSAALVRNFNFNVAHHGDFVVLASEHACLVGVDVMSHDALIKESPMEYIANFRPQFSQSEWENITRCGTHLEVLSQFYRHWCMKEAYIKAVGIGLGFDLKRLEFYFPGNNIWAGVASVRVDGLHDPQWRFFLHELKDRHWVCVARGPPSQAVESLKNSSASVEFDEDGSYDKALRAYEAPFEVLAVENIVPPCRRKQFLELQELHDA